MTEGGMKKTRTSKGVFGFRTSNKDTTADVDSQPGLRDSCTSRSDSVRTDPSGKEGVRSIFRKRGSKLLSILRLRSSRGSQDLPCIAQEIPEPRKFQRFSSAPVAPIHTPISAVWSPEPILETPFPSLIPVKSTGPVDLNAAHLEIIRRNGLHIIQQDDTVTSRTSDPAAAGEKQPVSHVRRSYSTPSLTHRISHKFSMAFGHPTVVHRTNLRPRPGIRSISAIVIPPKESGQNVVSGNVQDESDPSTAQSWSGSSPISQSTNPTSDGVPILPSLVRHSSSNKLDKIAESVTPRCGSPENKPSIQLPPVVVPSIITVEATATAKIFFETHFNSLLSGESPRLQRHRQLEERLYSLPLSLEERTRARRAWILQESEYLRHHRVLKTRSNSVKHGETVSIAGYEVIKVLGKGSFGVVRLVKERTAAQQGNEKSAETSKPLPKNDLSYLKANTIDALKSAVDGSRPSRRRDLGKMKKEVFAMKVIRKSDMLRNCQEGHLRAERDFLVASEKSRWIVPLLASFQDANNLYLVMDYMVGGDFLGLLIRKNILSEDVTRWYIAEMVLCVEEAHRLRWIHRDVKPDNFLISASGHLKISDFGLAFDGHWAHDQNYFNNHRHSLLKKLGIHIEGDAQDQEDEAKRAEESSQNSGQSKTSDDLLEAWGPGPNEDILRWRNRKEKRRLARSVVGTSQYMAPEVIRGEPYDGRCDWWSIGTILYECLYGFTPFAAETRHDTKVRILKHHQTLYFPTDKASDRIISADAIDLIGQILQEKEYRLCSRKYMLNDYVHSKRLPGELVNRPADKNSKNYQGYFVYPDDAEDIKRHSFFAGIRWGELHLRKPPFVPKVKSWEDTKYFDEEDPISDVDDGSTVGSTAGELDGAKYPGPDACHAIQLDGASMKANTNVAKKHGSKLEVPLNTQGKVHKKKKEKKRPRDKILRDGVVGKQALDMRKRGAFLGYTYRRPRDVLLGFEIERGRTLVGPGDVA
ncbi:AGC/NDR/NDR protein kinase [Polytolypa hystricis UAMH7299]|uniref:non-specific serine/threonine protein kinase n=1 Tax=Polytolypa hystricis (strain UAMH7299) TaxID=1447883 RepID=A0A2B7XX09_POLH7|nr:AGC/NDR/NDR protein kinase [Polytolypa hystricis UAMH7299]